MSEQLPIKVSPSPQAAGNKLAAASSNDDVSAEKQSGFGNVLSNQVKQQDVEKSQSASNNPTSTNETSHVAGEDGLPQDGNALPELAATEEVDAELVPEGDESVVLAAPVVAVENKPVGAAPLNANSQASAAPVITQTTQAEVLARLSPATVAGEAADDSAQAQAVSQLRQVESQEGNVISLTARAQVEKTSLQTNKIIEQFTDVGGRQATPLNTVSAPVTALSPVTTSSSVTTTASGLQQVSIDVPVQHQQWQRAFAERVVWSVGNSQSVQVRINPAELGPIDIQLNVSKEQTNITFNTSHAMTRDTIELALPRLRDMLASEGLNLGDVDVRHQDSSNASQDQGSGKGQNSGFGNQEPLADGQSELLLQPVIISERAVDFYI